MSTKPFKAVLSVIALAGSLEQRLSPALGSVCGVSFRDYLLLLNLYRAPKRRMRRVDLAAILSIGQSSISHMSDPLEKRGLVLRDTDAHDARVSYLALSESGLQLVEEATAMIEKMVARLFDERWTQEDVDLFSRRLDQLNYGTLAHIAVDQ